MFIRFDGTDLLTAEEWQAFCNEHAIEEIDGGPGRRPILCHGGRTGVNVEWAGDSILFTTWFGGPKVNALVEIASAFWIQFGGAMFADERVRQLICGKRD